MIIKLVHVVKRITYAAFMKNPPIIINGIMKVGANVIATCGFGAPQEIMYPKPTTTFRKTELIQNLTKFICTYLLKPLT